MPEWLAAILVSSGLWNASQPAAVSLVVTERFEVYLIRSPRQLWPTLVGKIGRDEASTRLLEREHAFLSQRAPLGGEALAGFMPQSFGSFAVPGRQPIWLQTGQSGSQVRPVLDEAVFDRVSGWLAHLATASRSEPLRLPEMYLSGASGEGEVERRILAYDAALQLSGRIPAVWEHGDLNPTNVLIEVDQVRAVDWVWAQPRGKPLFDWFDFCIHVAVQSPTVRGQGGLPAWKRLAKLLAKPESHVNRLVGRGVRQVSEALGIQEEDRQALRTLYFTTRFWSILEHNYPGASDQVTLRALGM